MNHRLNQNGDGKYSGGFRKSLGGGSQANTKYQRGIIVLIAQNTQEGKASEHE